MTRKQLPFFLAFLVLMFGAMACACLGSGAGIGGFQATANAAYTQAAGAAATINAASTQALATSGASTSGGSSGGDATPTKAASTGGGSGAQGGPSDIPIMTGDTTNMVATAQAVAYQTKADSATVVKFYKDAMPKNGWAADATTTVESPVATILGFKKDTHTAIVTVSKDPSSGQTVVAIAIQ